MILLSSMHVRDSFLNEGSCQRLLNKSNPWTIHEMAYQAPDHPEVINIANRVKALEVP